MRVHRRFWVALHRYLGLGMLLLLLVNALTGSVLAFHCELDAWLNPRLLRVAHAGPALGADEIVRRVEAADRRLRVALMPLDAMPGDAYELQVEPRIDPHAGRPFVLGFDRLLIDPASGAVLGRRTWGAARLDRAHVLGFLEVLHRKLHLPGKWGMWATGSLALAWLAAAVVGAWLTLPRAEAWRRGFWSKWKPAWAIRWGAPTPKVLFDVHRCLGLWTWPLAMVLGVSGVYFSLGDEVFKPMLMWFQPISEHPMRTLTVRYGPHHQAAFGLEEGVRRARMHLVPAARNFLPWYGSHLPKQGAYRIAFKEDGMRKRALRLRYEQIFIDDQTGELLATTGYDSGTTGDRTLIWQYPLHTGRILGIWGRVGVCLAGIATAVVTASGLAVWGLRRRSN